MQLPIHKNNVRTTAMTLIEVLVALTIVSFVFSSLTQMTFDALKRTKKLELQDKMRNYATEAVQVVYNAKDKDWAGTFGDTGIMPHATKNATVIQRVQGAIEYNNNVTQNGGDENTQPTVKGITYADCHFDEETKVLVGQRCAETSSNETETTINKKFFGRVIIRHDDDFKDINENRDTPNDVSLEIIVACLEGRCSSVDYPPFKLSLSVYRTSGPQ